MKKLLSLVLALALCLSLTVIPAHAAGDFTIEDGVLTSYTGSARSVAIPEGVTAIGFGAFDECENVTEIKIPNTVTSISRAFSGCENLKSITIPASVTEIEEGAFYSTELTNIEVDSANAYYTSVDGVLFNRDKTLLVQYPRNKTGSTYTVPDGVTHIGYLAFGLCENLTNVTLPDGVTSIGEGAFTLCHSLTNISIPSSVTDFGHGAFGETPWLEQLGEFPIVNHCLLEGPAGKSSVVIPDGMTTICKYAFWAYNRTNEGDGALKSVTIPDSVTKICEGAFGDCPDLSELTLPNNLIEMGEDAFGGCESLTSLTIPSSLTSIAPRAFCEWNGLTNLTIPGNIVEIGRSAFAQCTNLTTLTLSPGVQSIGEAAFERCSKLTNFTIPSSVKTIGKEAFSDCTSLTNVTISDGVTEIARGSFYNCTNLTDIVIPPSVTVIDKSAFEIRIDLGDGYGDWVINKKLTIHGTAGSYAETYAKENSIPFVADVSVAPVQPSASASPTRFTDVSASSPFADAISWAVDQKITAGKTANTFAPSENCTNGQILTFLWRANGSPEPTIENPFTDSIPASFQKAAVWAHEKGLVSGTTFGSSTPCTRAMAVEYIWKTAGSPNASQSSNFTDVSAGADYAQAVAWAVESGVTNGTGNGTFSPNAICTRGQIVTFLYRALKK